MSIKFLSKAIEMRGELTHQSQSDNDGTLASSAVENAAVSHLRYRPEIDGLRAIAVMIVVLFHAGLGFSGGYVGVDVFFVISGFLITSIVTRELNANKFTMKGFYERRIRRIVPALVVTVIATTLAAWFVFMPDDYRKLGEAVVMQPLMTANIYYWRNTAYFDSTAETIPLLHTWSLAVEEQFYLAFPLLLAVLTRIHRSLILPTVIGLLCISFGISVWGTSRYPGAAFYLLPTRAWELLLGSVVAIIPAHFFSWNKSLRETVGYIALLVLAGVIYSYDSTTLFPGYHALLPCLAATLLITTNTPQLTSLGKALSCKPLVFLGQISYSLYLVHWPIIVLYKYWNWEDRSYVTGAALVAASLIVGFISWSIIETPIRKKWILSTPRSLWNATFASIIIVSIMGVSLWVTKGVKGRFDQLAEAMAESRENVDFLRELKEPFQARNLLVFGEQTSTDSIMIWGDSHAMSLSPSLHTVCKQLGIKGVQATRSSTAPLLNFEGKNDGWPTKTQSPQLSRDILDYAIRTQVKVVVLAGMWQKYADDPTFSSCLQATLNELRTAGIHTVIVRDVANFENDIPRTIARAIKRHEKLSTLGMPLQEHRMSNEKVDKIFLELESDCITVLDPAPFFVDKDNIWQPLFEQQSMYRDAHHLSILGAQKLNPMFFDFLKSTSPKYFVKTVKNE